MYIGVYIKFISVWTAELQKKLLSSKHDSSCHQTKRLTRIRKQCVLFTCIERTCRCLSLDSWASYLSPPHKEVDNLIDNLTSSADTAWLPRFSCHYCSTHWMTYGWHKCAVDKCIVWHIWNQKQLFLSLRNTIKENTCCPLLNSVVSICKMEKTPNMKSATDSEKHSSTAKQLSMQKQNRGWNLVMVVSCI